MVTLHVYIYIYMYAALTISAMEEFEEIDVIKYYNLPKKTIECSVLKISASTIQSQIVNYFWTMQ